MMIKRKNVGFTLIELLVVISIISLLSSIAFATLGNVKGKARDTLRKFTLLEFQKALELYYEDHGYYPATAIFPHNTFSFNYVQHSVRSPNSYEFQFDRVADYIPGLVPDYMPSYPEDIGGTAPMCLNFYRGYYYWSNGKGYRISSKCSMEYDFNTDPTSKFYVAPAVGPVIYEWALCGGDVSISQELWDNRKRVGAPSNPPAKGWCDPDVSYF